MSDPEDVQPVQLPVVNWIVSLYCSMTSSSRRKCLKTRAFTMTDLLVLRYRDTTRFKMAMLICRRPISDVKAPVTTILTRPADGRFPD